MATPNLATGNGNRENWAGLMAKGKFGGALEVARSCGDGKCARAAALALYDSLMRQAYEQGRMVLYSDARKVAVENGLGWGRVRAAEMGMNEAHPAHRND